MIRPSLLVLVCLSVDVTGALALPNSFLLRLSACAARPSPYLSPLSPLLSCRCCPPLFCFLCVSLRVVPGGMCVFLCFVWLRGHVVLLCSVCSSRVWCGYRVSRVACSPLLFPVSCRLASPALRLVSVEFWSSLHSCVLVPPSEYLVAAVTAPLPCFM